MDLKKNYEKILVITGALVIVAIAVGLPFILYKNVDLQIQFALSQLSFSAVAFLVVFFTFYFSIIQLRKVMAKPVIKMAFNEKGENQDTLIFENGHLTDGELALWIINQGKAVARYFQIDLRIPKEYINRKDLSLETLTHGDIFYTEDNNNFIISFVNEGRYTLFVNKPIHAPIKYLSTVINRSTCPENNCGKFEISYIIYGDWNEIQKGILTVKIRKQ